MKDQLHSSDSRRRLLHWIESRNVLRRSRRSPKKLEKTEKLPANLSVNCEMRSEKSSRAVVVVDVPIVLNIFLAALSNLHHILFIQIALPSLNLRMGHYFF